LIGEAVDISIERKMRKIISSASGVEHLVDLKTLYVGPVELFVAMKITVNANDSAKIVATTIDEVEAKLRSEFPYAKLIYIEPDIFRSKSQQRSHDKLYSEKYKKA
jgi:divalent metal cation (Fe/Co/Zn/Cd) transporter